MRAGFPDACALVWDVGRRAATDGAPEAVVVEASGITEGTDLAPAGSRPDCRSPFGVYDMSGNVAEWTAEVADGSSRYVAGGDWSGSEAFTRGDAVVPFNPGLTSPRVGFRCCRTIAAPAFDKLTTASP